MAKVMFISKWMLNPERNINKLPIPSRWMLAFIFRNKRIYRVQDAINKPTKKK